MPPEEMGVLGVSASIYTIQYRPVSGKSGPTSARLLCEAGP